MTVGKHPASPMKNEHPPKRLIRKYSTRNTSAPSMKIRSFDLTPIERFNGKFLPTKGDVLRRYFYIRDKTEQTSTSTRELAKQVYQEIVEIRMKIPCDLREEHSVLDQITKLNKRYREMRTVKSSSKKEFMSYSL